jgi:hypothetical protein
MLEAKSLTLDTLYGKHKTYYSLRYIPNKTFELKKNEE